MTRPPWPADSRGSMVDAVSERIIVEESVQEPAGSENGRQPRVQSVAKAISILMVVARSSNGLRTTEIIGALSLPRQATYHLLHTLVTLGLLARNGDGRYVLGLRVGTLVEAFPRHLAPPERLAPYVRQVAFETGETAYAVGWWEGEIVTLAVIRGRNAIQAAEVPHGLYADPHARAAGKLLLALADGSTRDRFLATHDLVRRTANTITDPAALRAELAQIRASGLAFDRQEYAEGLCCLAVPIHDGTVPFALGLSSPAERFAKESERYIETIRRISTAGAPFSTGDMLRGNRASAEALKQSKIPA